MSELTIVANIKANAGKIKHIFRQRGQESSRLPLDKGRTWQLGSPFSR